MAYQARLESACRHTGDRGFESHPLRHSPLRSTVPLFGKEFPTHGTSYIGGNQYNDLIDMLSIEASLAFVSIHCKQMGLDKFDNGCIIITVYHDEGERRKVMSLRGYPSVFYIL